MEQIRGVNLGGWLVLEKWMTPGLFAGTDATDEYTLCEAQPELATQRIREHRASFITEDTIKQIADLGLNTVRLPIGYWLFGGHEPYVDGGDEYVEKLFEWCDSHGVGVILDVHAAPGSQNGWDHSGRSGHIGWGHGDTVEKTLAFVDSLIDRCGNKTALRALEVLNEPHWDVSIDTLTGYYQQAYDRIRARVPQLTVVMSDAFRPEQMAKKLQKRKFTEVILDVHLYQLFTEEDRALDLAGHIRKTEGDWAKMLSKLTKRMPVMVGEWSAAMHEMYQPINQPSHVRGYTNDDYVTYFRTQQRMFEDQGVGWTYWTARTAGGGPWSLLNHPEYLV